jgi:transposase-like protein
MTRKRKRQYRPEEKLQILEEARQPNTTVVEVLRRHQVDDATTFYRWEQHAKEDVRAALTRDRRRTEADAKDREIERLRAELVKKSRITAEVIEEKRPVPVDGAARGEGGGNHVRTRARAGRLSSTRLVDGGCP